jgi:hypothetical protein
MRPKSWGLTGTQFWLSDVCNWGGGLHCWEFPSFWLAHHYPHVTQDRPTDVRQMSSDIRRKRAFRGRLNVRRPTQIGAHGHRTDIQVPLRRNKYLFPVSISSSNISFIFPSLLHIYFLLEIFLKRSLYFNEIQTRNDWVESQCFTITPLLDINII